MSHDMTWQRGGGIGHTMNEDAMSPPVTLNQSHQHLESQEQEPS